MCADVGNKTQIVYNSNINFHAVGAYLDMLINNDLAREIQGRASPVKDYGQGGQGDASGYWWGGIWNNRSCRISKSAANHLE
jgi:hypothetical protein